MRHFDPTGHRVPMPTHAVAAASEAVTACDGWITQEITAHLAAGAAEIVRHLDPYLQGEAVPQARSWEVREAPFEP